MTATRTRAEEFLDAWAMARIEYRLDRLALAFRLGEQEIENLRQQMAAELTKASARFDPARSSQRTFVNRVLDRWYLYTARRLRRQRECRLMRPLESEDLEHSRSVIINDPAPGELSDDDRTGLRIDLAEFMAGLPPHLACVAEELMTFSPVEAARRLDLHPATVHRHMRELKRRLAAAGLTRES